MLEYVDWMLEYVDVMMLEWMLGMEFWPVLLNGYN